MWNYSFKMCYFTCIKQLCGNRSSHCVSHSSCCSLIWVLHIWPMKRRRELCPPDSCLVSFQPPSKALSSILGKSNLQFAGMSINLNISTSSLNLMTPDGKQVSVQTITGFYEPSSQNINYSFITIDFKKNKKDIHRMLAWGQKKTSFPCFLLVRINR